MLNRIILSIIIFIALSPFVYADNFNYTVFEIENVINEEKFELKNNIVSDIILLTPENNAITKINTILYAKNNGTNGISYNLSNNIQYTLTAEKVFYLGFIPYIKIEHFAVVNNYTIFNQSKEYLYFIAFDIHNEIIYNINTQNTTFSFRSPNMIESATNGEIYELRYYTGMPANNLKILALNKFDTDITVTNLANVLDMNEQINDLSFISKTLYKILTLGGVLGENESLLHILLVVDLFFSFINLIFSIIFVYPYLIGIWLITFGNFYAGFKSDNYRELVENYMEYLTKVCTLFYDILQKCIEFIISIINIIRG